VLVWQADFLQPAGWLADRVAAACGVAPAPARAEPAPIVTA
jgi:hypothetical protein